MIRPACTADAAAIERCVKSAYHPYIARIGKPPAPMLEDYQDVIRRHLVFVAEQDARIIGVLVLVTANAGMILDNVAVDPAYQSRGLGRQLLELAEVEARKRGYDHLDLYTHELMTENIAMYAALGYVETGRKSERGYERVYLRKTLS
jgi:ribosomal protein S18 acetylase RimI-like enzyme